MTAITNLVSTVQPSGRVRPFDVRRDLKPVADLVELCFAKTLDPDGQRYLRQMRVAARDPSYMRWTRGLAGAGPIPMSGYVWEEDGRVVGNLTLIPFFSPRYRYYLIANVAVHPDYRRRGIARSLTAKAVEFARRRGVRSAWLHARHDNNGAVELYRTAGFHQRARRTTWQYVPEANGSFPTYHALPPELSSPGTDVGPRRSSDWPEQRTWLDLLYPPELSWHMRLSANSLKPGLWGFLYRMFNENSVHQWSIRRGKQLLGVLAWQASLGYADNVWLAASPESEDGAVTKLLQHALRHLPRKRSLTLDYPAGRASQAIQAAGFREHQTLIWMELPFE
jgi:GNAT superfamily N-acetyltransferase